MSSLITIEQLRLMVPYSSPKSREKFIEPLNSAMLEYEINTDLRIAAFIAQIAHESGSLRYLKELASGAAYEYREDLGNLEQEALIAAHKHGNTSGKFYRGRGLIQLTGYYNYLKYGELLGLDLVNNPDLLCLPEPAARSAACFWNENKLNKLADGKNFSKITKIINGGTNGAKERLDNFERCLKVLY